MTHTAMQRGSTRTYEILNERPPEWIMTGCLDQFRVNVDRTFWTYGDAIYNPGGGRIPDHILAHEEQHMAQQEAFNMDAHIRDAENGKDGWWKMYLAVPRFRLEQEADAYGAQYKFYCQRVADRNKRAQFLQVISTQLASPLYQLAVTQPQAREMILILSGHKPMPKQPVEQAV